METLPPINQKQQATGGNESSTEFIARAKARGRRETRFLTWKDQQERSKDKIRAQLPIISKIDAAVYRSTFMHNLCINMLKEGYHKSFSELYNLLADRRKRRLLEGPDSTLWEETPLHDQHEKLEELAKYLTKAETVQRHKKWKDVYECRVRLAEYFLTSGDRWLSDHFFSTALDVSRNIRLDGRRREAEAHCNRALAYERNGSLQEAVEHMRQFHEITGGQPWRNDDDVALSSLACRHLCRIYTALADGNKNIDQQLRYLNQALKVASESNETLQKAKCGLNIAKKYEETGDSKTAIECLNECLEMAQDLGDAQLCGAACRAMATSLQSIGDIKRALDYFEMYAETSKQAGLLPQVVSASCCLSKVNITQGEYEKSVDHSEAAYKFTKELEPANIAHPSVLVGLARGFAVSSQYHQVVEERTKIRRLLEWKNERIGELDRDSIAPTDSRPGSVTGSNAVDPTAPFQEHEIVVHQKLSLDQNIVGLPRPSSSAHQIEHNKEEDEDETLSDSETSFVLPPASSDESSGPDQKS